MAAIEGKGALTREEWEGLPGRPRMPEDSDAPPMLASVSVSDLFRRDSCERYLDWLGEHIGAPSRRVTASMLAKRYAFLLAVPVLHAMSAYNKGLLLDPLHCRLVSPDYSGYAVSSPKFPELLAERMPIIEPSAGKRHEWRDRVLHQLFAGHLSPLFHSLSDTAKVPLAILWENAAVRIAPYYEEEPHEGGDYEYMASPASAWLFDGRRNPLSRFLVPLEVAVGKYAARPRSTCCLYYEMAPEYCRKCPRIKQPSTP